MPLVSAFNKLYYYLRKNTFDQAFFMGKHVLKFPTDLWIYQEIIFERKPDVIIETGVFLGGSTYYFAKLCEMFGHGRVIAVDITLAHADPDLVALPNVTLLQGNTSDPHTLERVKSLVRENETVMVILDSDHEPEHVFQEIKLLSTLVTEGQYLVVEDGIIEDAYPVFCNRGPLIAIRRFLKESQDFVPDYFRNRFLLTHTPSGYLLRVSKDRRENLKFRKAEDTLRPFRLWLPDQPFPADMSWLRYLNQNRPQQ
jgi:cephalosporin hydroxylase